MKTPAPIMLGFACAATLAAGCSSTVATVDGPDYRQKLGTPQPIAVNLDAKRADADSFAATINGNDITDAFVFTDQTARLADDFVFEPTAGREPHRVTVSADPSLNAKGRPMGQPFAQTLTFFPPEIRLQGNVGIGANSRVDVPRDGRTSVMIKLPQSPKQATTLTVQPVAPTQVAGNVTAQEVIDCVALNDHEPGEPITLTIKPGQRVAVFTVRGHTPGVNELRVEAPGYVASEINVFVDGPAATPTASVDTY
ncbi:MAG: hypothetical protein AAGH99_14025 [Planctomycetota bacterium]